jgi:peptide/nickel transport system substrate-binding protein
LAKINIKVDLQTMPKAQYWQRFDERAGDIMMIGWQSDTQDSANFYEFLVMTPDKDKGYGQLGRAQQRQNRRRGECHRHALSR